MRMMIREDSTHVFCKSAHHYNYSYYYYYSYHYNYSYYYYYYHYYAIINALTIIISKTLKDWLNDLN